MQITIELTDQELELLQAITGEIKDSISHFEKDVLKKGISMHKRGVLLPHVSQLFTQFLRILDRYDADTPEYTEPPAGDA